MQALLTLPPALVERMIAAADVNLVELVLFLPASLHATAIQAHLRHSVLDLHGRLTVPIGLRRGGPSADWQGPVAARALDVLARHISQVAGAATELRLGWDDDPRSAVHALSVVGAADAAELLAGAVASMPRLARLNLTGWLQCTDRVCRAPPLRAPLVSSRRVCMCPWRSAQLPP
jgi:hypothetical protein